MIRKSLLTLATLLILVSPSIAFDDSLSTTVSEFAYKVMRARQSQQSASSLTREMYAYTDDTMWLKITMQIIEDAYTYPAYYDRQYKEDCCVAFKNRWYLIMRKAK